MDLTPDEYRQIELAIHHHIRSLGINELTPAPCVECHDLIIKFCMITGYECSKFLIWTSQMPSNPARVKARRKEGIVLTCPNCGHSWGFTKDPEELKYKWLKCSKCKRKYSIARLKGRAGRISEGGDNGKV